MKDQHFSSRMLAYSGTLMILAGILFAVCVKISYGALMLPAGLCMLFAARSFRIAEDRANREQRDSETNPENPKTPQSEKTNN